MLFFIFPLFNNINRMFNSLTSESQAALPEHVRACSAGPKAQKPVDNVGDCAQ